MQNNPNELGGASGRVLALAVWGALLSPAYATGTSELDEVVVQASRNNSSQEQSKRSVAVVTRRQLDEQQPDSVAPVVAISSRLFAA